MDFWGNWGLDERTAATQGPWYHATGEQFTPGTVLEPGDSIGSHAQGGYSDGSKVWVSNDPVRASAYGFHVYEVDPHDEPRSPHGNDEHHTSGATVIREVPEADINQWRRTYDPAVGWRTAARLAAPQHFSRLVEADLPPMAPGLRPGTEQMRGHGRIPVAPVPSGQDYSPDGDWVNRDWRNATDGGALISSVRPPMSSDVPHPAKILDPHDARQAKVLAHTQRSRDPENDPWNVLDGTDTTFEDLVQHHLSHQLNMTPEQAYQGRVWYRAAHEATRDLAAATTGSHGRAVATMSAFSPKTEWDENMEKGHHFLTHYDGSDPNFTIPGLQKHVETAKSIYHAPGDTWQGIIKGPKTSAFAHNILDPVTLREPRPGEDDDVGYYQYPINPATGEPDWRLHPDQDVTVDTHHVRMANTPHGADLSNLRYETPVHFGKNVTVGGKTYHPGYDLYARAAWEATRRANALQNDPLRHLVPKQVQAGPWTKFKNDLDQTLGRTVREPGSPPQSYRPDKGPEGNWGMGELNPQAIPRYQRDPGGWVDPRRPDLHLRQTPNWHRRPSHFGALGSSWWNEALADYIARNPRRDVLQESREVLAWVGRILGE